MESFFYRLMDWFAFGLQWLISKIDGPLWDATIVVLLGVGTLFTIITGLVQLRMFPHSLREMWMGRRSSGNSLTPFQAFTTGLASRVGVGNVAGVATAIAVGGPGAVFWMWVTALLGMSSAFAESTLAQVYKVRNEDGSFRGGPAYYITKGLRFPLAAMAFAVSLIFAFGFAFNAVQANSIVEATQRAWGWDAKIVAYALVLLAGLVIFGGVKRIGQFSSALVPSMALFYLIIAAIILGMNITSVPEVLSLIVNSAFDFSAAAGGLFGWAISQAMLQGIRRGLFSNEAGMGSAPNSAATADTEHPASQGLVQMLGVFVDTMVVCTCTAVIILLSDNYGDQALKGVALTQEALKFHVGEFGVHFLAFVLFLFAFSSILGNYAYAESNVRFIKNNRIVVFIFRVLVLFFVFFGAISGANVVWDFADTVMAFMALINLVALIPLAPVVLLVLKDYSQQLRKGQTPRFILEDHPALLRKGVDPRIWGRQRGES